MQDLESLTLMIAYIVCHDTELMQGGLTVEENNITINQVTFNNVPVLK